MNILIGGILTCQGELTVGDGNMQGAYMTFNVEKSGIVGSGKVIVSNINVISDQAQFVVSVSQLTVSNNVQMGGRKLCLYFRVSCEYWPEFVYGRACREMDSWGKLLSKGRLLVANFSYVIVTSLFPMVEVLNLRRLLWLSREIL